MSYKHARDFLFCRLCGCLLSTNSTKFSKCPLCGYKRDVKEMLGREITYTISAEEIRRELGLQPHESNDSAKNEVKRAVTQQACPKCRHPELEYYTKQLRSADEGQTVFYECPKCGHKFSENT